jgi:hypothetical protein
MPRWVDQAEALVLAAMRELFRDNQLLEFAGRAAIERKPYRVAPSSCRRSAMWVTFQGAYAISLT